MDILAYIKQEETNFQTVPIPVTDGYEWNMFKHIQRTTLYLNSRFEQHTENYPFRNIILDKVNLQHRAVAFDLKEIDLYVNNPNKYHLSFLIKKASERWARKNNISAFLDTLTETYTDYGGVLIKKTKNSLPEVVPFNRIAFVDQTSMLSGAICEKHQLPVDKIIEMKPKWKNVDEVVANSTKIKTTETGQVIHTPSPYVTVYELHLVAPESWYIDGGDTEKYVRQLHIVADVNTEDGKKGISLFAGIEKELPYKEVIRDPIPGRALGRGGVEELFQEQIWTNYNEGIQKDMLDQASKVIYIGTDPAFANRNDTRNAENGDYWVYEGSPVTRLQNQPFNYTVFENKVRALEEAASKRAAAFDAISGNSEGNATMPFRSAMLFNQEAHSLHKYRKGKIGIELTNIWKDWLLDEFKSDIKTESFITSLSSSELKSVINAIFNVELNKKIKNILLKEKRYISAEEMVNIENYIKSNLQKTDKVLVELVAEELKGLELELDIITTNEQANKALVAEKLSSVWSTLAQNPQVLEIPGFRELFNDIIEASGLSSVKFDAISPSGKAAPQENSGQIQQLDLLTEPVA